MDLQLRGKRALVTGSTRGIGAAIAKALAWAGASVVVHGRDREAAKRVVREIGSAKGKAFVSLGDLSVDVEAERVAEEAESSMGGVDILVNNAGIYPSRDWWRAKPEEWADIYNTNVVSIVRVVHRLAPSMKERGWGRIINIGSGAALQPSLAMPDFSATKAATVNLTVSLSRELAGSGVTVNTISPGPIFTEGVEEFYRAVARERGWALEWSEIERRVMEEMLPNSVGRFGRVEEVAALAAFVASPLAGFINGANLRIDGGTIRTI
ncbi:MAG: SDR family NAD(P)-dependent oxidoreductase [SAR202 cluster bacterium]|nr:SDR family NAD(P)-dependent oxidoreductase [SAR202 cluster bacterium]